MNKVVLAVAVLAVLSSGCIGGKQCREVTREVLMTKSVYELVPVNVTVKDDSAGMRIEREVTSRRLSYSVLNFTSGVLKEGKITYDDDRMHDWGRPDQNVTAYSWVQVKNTDSVGGGFTVIWSYRKRGVTVEKNRTLYIDAGANQTFEFTRVISRGDDWDYEFRVIPGREKLTEPRIVYTGEEVVTATVYNYTMVSRNVWKNVTEKVCD